LSPKNVKKISISLSSDVISWVDKNKGDMKVSTFINKILKEQMSVASLKGYDISDELKILEHRLKKIEEDLHDMRHIKDKKAGILGKEEHISILSTRPKDVFGELVSIKNVSAENANTVYEELFDYIKNKKVIDRDMVIKELFPRTKSSITNNINYWYNACKGVLAHLIEEGYVVRLEKNRYKWAGRNQN
jgi:hypothetical protein